MDGVLFHPETPHHLGALKTRLEKATEAEQQSVCGSKGLV